MNKNKVLDPVVERTRAARDALARQCGYDPDAMLALFKSMQAEHPQRVRRPSVPSAALGEAARGDYGDLAVSPKQNGDRPSLPVSRSFWRPNMREPTSSSRAQEPPVSLVLNTWLVMYLHEGERARPGGLPNDFLVHCAPALLVFDDVVCDVDALEAEKGFADVWVISRIFSQLAAAGVLRPVNFREHFTQEFSDHLRDVGYADFARRQMDALLERIRSSRGRRSRLSLPDFLTQLNNYMFLGLDIPHAVRYGWQEYHFRPPKATVAVNQSYVEGAPTERRFAEQSLRAASLQRAIRMMIPDFSLVRPPTVEEKRLLRKNIELEKAPLYRWICGDPDWTRERYREFRRRPAFRRVDKLIDQGREYTALKQLDTLLKVRNKTQDVRPAMQRTLSDLLHGRRTLRDVKKDIEEQRAALLGAAPVPTRPEVKLDIALGGVGVVVTLAGILLNLAGLQPIGLPLSGGGLGLAGYRFWRARARQNAFTVSRRRFPHAWLLAELERHQSESPRKG